MKLICINKDTCNYNGCIFDKIHGKLDMYKVDRESLYKQQLNHGRIICITGYTKIIGIIDEDNL